MKTNLKKLVVWSLVMTMLIPNSFITKAESNTPITASNTPLSASEDIKYGYYGRYEAEDYSSWSAGSLKIESSSDSEGNALKNLGGTATGAWIAYTDINFTGNGLDKFKVRYANKSSRCGTNARLELHLDAVDGELVDTITIPSKDDNWATYQVKEQVLANKVSGVHDLYIVMLADTDKPYVSNLDWFELVQGEDSDTTSTNVWSTSFETTDGTDGFKANTLDSKGSNSLKAASSNAMLGDITYLVDSSTITGSVDYNATETKAKLFDKTSTSKFLTNVGVPVTVAWSLTGKAEKTVNQYSIVSANDADSRDPKTWKLYGKKEADADYTLIDSRTDERFTARYQQKNYTISSPAAYSSYKLEMSANYGNGSMTQFADIILATGNTADDQYQTNSLNVNLSNGPSSAWNQKSNAGWTGSKALQVSGSITGQDAYQYNTIYSGLSIPVEADTNLKYCIFPSMSNGDTYDYQYTQMYTAVDLKFSDGTYLSDLAALDQNRNKLEAKSQGDSKALTTNQWNQIYSNIGKVADGKTIEAVLVDYKKPTHDMTGLKDLKTYFDDIEIYNKEEPTVGHLSNYTNILRGTNDTPSFSRGLTAPAVTMPHGFNFWVPATNTGDNKIYDYQDTSLRFMTVCHEPSYWIGDRGTWQFMVNTSVNASTATSFGLGSLTSDFSHNDEIAHANYYSVEFDKTKGASKGSKLEMTPTEHGAVVRYTFDDDVTNRNVLFDCVRATGGITFDNTGSVTTFQGFSDHTSNGSKRMYVYGIFDKKATIANTVNKAGIASFTDSVVEMKIATSYISYDQAKKNLGLEIASYEDFDDIYAQAQYAWDEKLSTISDVKGANYEQLVTLYSNLYRLFAYPNTMSENTGTESAPVWKYKSPYRADAADPVDGQIYINNGFWDTYRTTWAAYGLFTPNNATNLLNGLVQHYTDQGWVPRWIAPGGTNSMVGTSSDVIFADALVKGIDFNYEDAYNSAIRNAATVSTNLTNGGRDNLNTSIFLGYTPGSGEDFSWSMEGYINDFGISQMAKVLAEKETDATKKAKYLSEYTYYQNRAKNYVKLFDDSGETTADKWLRGKDASGEWTTANYTNDVFDPFFWGNDYTETNAYNMAVSVPQDGEGLASLYGGRDELATKIDTIFETNGIYNGYGANNSVGGIHEQKEAREIKLGQYGHSNQPSHHIPYMYNYAAQPWKTQKYTRDIMDRAYAGATFGQGYIGDEDNGEMSAWYVFSALGFYPLSMGSDEYAIGSPLFDEVTVNLQNGKTLTVKANNNSKENVYVQSMKLNGVDYTKSYLKHSDIANGGTIEFTMGSTPNKTWGSGENDLPTSITAAGEKVQAYEDLINPKAKTVNADTITTDMVYQDSLTSTVTDVTKLTDNTSSTATALNDGATIYYSMDKAKKVEEITITSSSTPTAPTSVEIYGAYEGGEWNELGTYNDLTFQWNQYTRPFAISADKQGEYAHYKLVFSECTVAEIELLGYDNGVRTREDLGNLIAASQQIDQTTMLQVLKDKLNAAIQTAQAAYAITTGTDEDYTNAYNALKKTMEMVTGDLTDAYSRMEAEAFDSGNVLVDMKDGVPNNIGGVKQNYWACYKNVLFKGDTNYLEMNYAAQGTDGGGYVEVYFDDKDSQPVATIQTPITTPGSGWSTYVTVTAAIDPSITGLHDVYLVFRNDSTHAYVANVDWFKFDAKCAVSATAGDHGNIDFTNKTVSYGEDISFNIDPDDGYMIDKVLVNGTDSGFQGNISEKVAYTLSSVAADTNIAISFKVIPKGSVTVSQVTGATITLKAGTPTTDITLGTEVSADIILNSNKVLNKVLVNGTALPETAIIKNLDDSYTVTFAVQEGNNVLTAEVSDKQVVPTAIDLNADSKTLEIGGTFTIIPSLSPSGVTTTLVYSSSNASVATVDSYGVVSAKAAGKTTITVTTANGLKATCEITVNGTVPTSSPTTSPTAVPTEKPTTAPTEKPTTAPTTEPTTEPTAVPTQKPTVAPTTIPTVQPTVQPTSQPTSPTPTTDPTSVKVLVNSKTLGVGEKFTLSYTVTPKNAVSKTTYSSSKSSVATVSSKGMVTAKKVGVAKITVKTQNGKTAICTVIVKKAPTSVKLNKKSLTLKVKKSYKLKATLSKKSAGSLNFKSSKTSIATVDKYGKIVAKKKGSTVITVKTYNGKKAKVTVKVSK